MKIHGSHSPGAQQAQLFNPAAVLRTFRGRFRIDFIEIKFPILPIHSRTYGMIVACIILCPSLFVGYKPFLVGGSIPLENISLLGILFPMYGIK